jgi:hypothetical protein
MFYPETEEQQGEVITWRWYIGQYSHSDTQCKRFVSLGSHDENQKIFPCQPCPRQKFKVIEAPLRGKLRCVL